MATATGRKLTVLALGFLTAFFPKLGIAQNNATYQVQAIAGQVVPYSPQNAHPNDIGLLPPDDTVIGDAYGELLGGSPTLININPVAVTTQPSGLIENIIGQSWPTSKADNLAYMSFGLWYEPSEANPITAWTTYGAYVAGTLSTGSYANAGEVTYGEYTYAYYTNLGMTPKHPLLLVSLPTASHIYVNYGTGVVSITIDFTDVMPGVTLSGNATLKGNSFTMLLSGSGLSGTAIGKLFGPANTVPVNVGGTFLVKSTSILLIGNFAGCRGSNGSC